MKRLSFFILLIFATISCSKKQPNRSAQPESNVNSVKAYNYRIEGKPDSAFKYFNIAKDELILLNDSIGIANSLLNMSIIATDEGDYYSGQEIALNAIDYLNEINKNHHWYIHANYNSIGYANSRLGNYHDALKYYNLALNLAVDKKDKLLYHNNIAKVYEELRNYDKAIKIYYYVLRGTKKETAPYAQALANIASTKLLQNPTYNAAPELFQALTINNEQGEKLQINFCYARLADFYSKMNKTLGLYYANKMYKLTKEINSPFDELEALYKLVILSPPLESKIHFLAFEKLSDSLQMSRAKAKNQFALIRYETEKHKAENLILQKKNTKQKSIVIGGLVLAFFISVLSIILYKKRKQRIELASQNAIRENQLKTSKKVHDVVANGIYTVMSEIENNEALNREHLLDKLEVMYEKSRDLSYEDFNYNDQNFHDKIASLLRSFATETTKVVLVGNTDVLWKKVSTGVKYEVEHILQELMVNMKKHSRSSNVAIRFEQNGNKIFIRYADDGIGMKSEQKFNNGLTNTGNRILSINGEITFDTKVEKGLKIQFSFPIS